MCLVCYQFGMFKRFVVIVSLSFVNTNQLHLCWSCFRGAFCMFQTLSVIYFQEGEKESFFLLCAIVVKASMLFFGFGCSIFWMSFLLLGLCFGLVCF